MAKTEKSFFTAVKELNGEKVEAIIEDKDEKARKFFAIRRIHRTGDHHPAYQIEVVSTKNGKLVEQFLIGSPDTLIIVMSKIQDILDPINSTENEDETNSIFT